MAVEYRSPDIRNIVILGHGGSGKTTLTDALCYISGSTTRRGQVENGTAHTDFTQEEIDHGISINLALARAEWMDTKLNLIDTPGYLDFFGEVMAGVRVADGALVVVGATTGVEVGTERCWRAAEARGLPRMVFISMMDRENANFDTAFQQVRNSFGSGAIPVEVPIGSGDHFTGIVNLFSGHAHGYRPNSDKGEYDHVEVPEEVAATVASYREQLIESIAATDDELLEAYLEGEELDRERVLAGMKQGMARGELFPVFCGSGESGRGARAVLKKLVELMPAPDEIGPVEATDARGNDVELEPKDDSPLTALVFKTTQEPRVGELSYFRVFTGKAEGGSTVDNATRGSTERISHIGIPDATSRDEVDRLHAGDIGVVAKLKDTHTGDTLSTQGKGLSLPGIAWPKADIAIALKPASRGEEDKLANGLAKLHEEDPTFSAAFDPELGQTIARGLGELHLNIALERLDRKYGVKVETEPPRIPYRETITRSAEGQGRYKKQTGGRGQFGDCWLRIRPRARGEGYEFINKIVGGAIPGKFIPAVDKGVKEAADRGVISGYPVVDFEVECYDGSYHSVDSSEMAFKIAGSMAFQKVVKGAKPILLEPIMTITVRVPEDYMGEVIGDLNQRRGRILGMDADGHWQEVKAHVPLAELYKYSTSLRSLTQGKGLHDREFRGYEPVPSDVAQKVIAEAEALKEAEGH
ncbi:MAG: elongation factor G [marine benthic group bacterium]|jgi:elongation factor G|nr:elongation factor G [Gemmatimonadota bacterium]MCL7963225.1 elongation factor G [Candidatus Carthagonibacter metallireducens]MCL7956558.1 elongation factor G [Gemmatimonadota bacterium]MCL7964204.1 elongation factor G [Gemmatimonadota bacterium]MCL7967357.1 elongation factor G [Gemmatimonadota bacterium]